MMQDNFISEQEKSIAAKYGLTESAYLQKREKYVKQQGTTWFSLTALSPEDADMVRNLQMDSSLYQQEKLKDLAVDVILKS
jgi:hypothetical protein